MVNPEHVAAARALKPIQERSVFGRSVMLFDGANREAGRCSKAKCAGRALRICL